MNPRRSAADERSHRHEYSSTPPRGRYLALLSLAALGIVFGDIGTSPLYAFRESFSPAYGLAASPANILGILSLIFWSLVIVISAKYLALVMRADNHGEGGIMALTALVTPKEGLERGGRRWLIVLLGLFGASLLYGDSMITPAISVLSAVEGLEVATPLFTPYVIPVTCGILVALFLFQSRGTTRVGALFGPVMLVWFGVLAALGLVQIVQAPEVFRAVNPLYAASFFARNGLTGFLVLGSVFLVVTGGEALYADMGHFGIAPIRLAWFVLVLPALLLNYFGQGALILRSPGAEENPFFLMAPSWALFPLVALATLATVIASQAVISGAFSLTRQAVQLGYLPRLNITQTSAKEIGQVYIGLVNWVLMVACILLVVGFGSSSRLAAAYGVGVTTDMVFTTLLFAVVARTVWGWSLPLVAALAASLLAVDLSFWGANLPKIPAGGWFPLLVGALMFTLLTTWKRGRELVGTRLREGNLPLKTFLTSLQKDPPARVPGTAIFMFRDPKATPSALLTNLKFNHVLHETVVILVVDSVPVPRVPAAKRDEVKPLGQGFFSVVLRYGFMEEIDVPKALRHIVRDDLNLEPDTLTFFLGRETLFSTPYTGMARWRERLFILLYRNARHAADYFRLPPERVIELGVQLEL